MDDLGAMIGRTADSCSASRSISKTEDGTCRLLFRFGHLPCSLSEIWCYKQPISSASFSLYRPFKARKTNSQRLRHFLGETDLLALPSSWCSPPGGTTRLGHNVIDDAHEAPVATCRLANVTAFSQQKQAPIRKKKKENKQNDHVGTKLPEDMPIP